MYLKGTKEMKKMQRYTQIQHPRTGNWMKVDTKEGKLVSIKKTKYKGVRVVPIIPTLGEMWKRQS